MDPAHDALDAVFARWALRERAPGLAWGLIRGGELVARGGIGTLRVGEDAKPDADSVFRIASMTKSFTGAALMSLVAEGRVHLDDPVATHVPALAGWRRPSADGPALSVRHLASMESGLPTDDPWADRHLDLSSEGMDALIGTGAAFARTPGTDFEYSNLGWGLIGRVIERASGASAQERVTQRLLAPLGMSSTTWTRPSTSNLAEPFEWRDGAWSGEIETAGDGTMAPMGGLWSTVADLARWVAFLMDAFPPRDDPDDGLLPRWARREMQQLRRVDTIDYRSRPRPDGPARVTATGYGIGLGIRLDERLGYVIGHSGGVPGYGSHMRWIPERGVGLVALSNVTYGHMHGACNEALDALADLGALGPKILVGASTALRDAATRSSSLLNAWDDAVAADLFADNMAHDESLERRAAEAARVVERHGALIVESLDAESPMRGSFTAAGGLVTVELGLNHAGDVQWLDVTDRSQPSNAPIFTDPARLAELPRSAYVLLRPTAGLADAFDRWRDDVLDRLGGVRSVIPAAHVTLKAFGSSDRPTTEADESRIVEVVSAWASATSPMELRAEALGVFDIRPMVPVVRLATGAIRPALADLWSRSADAGLPPGSSDHIGVEDWVPHLSLCYPVKAPDPAAMDLLLTWKRHEDIGDVASVAFEAEVVAFGDGAERRLGRFSLEGAEE